MKFSLFSLISLFQIEKAFSSQSDVSIAVFEVFQAMRTPQLQECQKKFPLDLANTIVKREVFRCPYCVDYYISGKKLKGNTTSEETMTLKIEIRGVPNEKGLSPIPKYSCSVSNN